MRHINESRILASLFRNGGMSRASLARDLGLTRSTVGNLVSGFVKGGWLLEQGEADELPDHRAGRPGLRIDLNPSHSIFIGADLAVDAVRLVTLDLKADIVKRRSAPLTSGATDPDAIIAQVATLLNDEVAALPDRGKTLRGICITVPGTIDRTGVVSRVPVFGWRNLPFAAKLRALLTWDGPLAFENDANAFAFAELYRARMTPLTGALCLYMDVGVGGGLIADGKLVYGAHGFAGEIGYIHVGDAAYARPGQMPGSFESHVGREAVLARHRDHGGRAVDLETFVAAVAAREPAALRTLDEWAFMLGRGMATLTSVLDPGHIILGGPVACLYGFAEAAVQRSVSQHLLANHPLPSVHVSALDTNASAFGGACILHHTLMSIDESLVFNGMSEP